MINQLQVKELFHYDDASGVFTRLKDGPRYKKGSSVGHKALTGYIEIYVFGKRYLAHRLAWLYVYGDWPENKIDHINGNKIDNRIVNLRDVSHAVNLQNRKSAGKSKRSGLPLGVYFESKKKSNQYKAAITLGNRQKHLGQFPTADAANQAYLTAKRKLHEGCTI